MQVVYNGFPVYNSSGSIAGILDGTYEATPNKDQQPGWHSLQKVNADGSVDDEVVANVHIVGFATI